MTSAYSILDNISNSATCFFSFSVIIFLNFFTMARAPKQDDVILFTCSSHKRYWSKITPSILLIFHVQLVVVQFLAQE